MTISVTCGKCGKTIQAPEALAGKRGKCPKCGEPIQIAARPDAGADPLAALAAAVGGGAAESPPKAPVTPAKPEPVKASPAKPEPARPAARPAPAKPEPAKAEPARPAEPAPEAVPVKPPSNVSSSEEGEEMIVHPPVGVQTPSGMPAAGRSGPGSGFRWQRRIASLARVAGFVLGGLCLPVGIAGMIMMVQANPFDMGLPLGLGTFFFLLIVGAALAAAGLFARHMLLTIVELGERVRRQETVLEELTDRLE